MAIIKQDYGLLNGGGIDLTSPDLVYPASGSSMTSGFTIPVTQKPKQMVYHVLVNNAYSFTYTVNFTNETAYRIGVYTGNSNMWNETKNYSDVITSCTDSLITLNTAEYSGYSAKVIAMIWY